MVKNPKKRVSIDEVFEHSWCNIKFKPKKQQLRLVYEGSASSLPTQSSTNAWIMVEKSESKVKLTEM